MWDVTAVRPMTSEGINRNDDLTDTIKKLVQERRTLMNAFSLDAQERDDHDSVTVSRYMFSKGSAT
eukprot:gene12554-20619_t